MARKKKNNNNGSGVDIGMVMTCSLFLIILTFFILLNSIAVIDDRKVRVAIGSLVGSFGSLTGGLSPMKTGESIMPPSAPIVKQKLDFNQLLNSMDAGLINHVRVITLRDRQIISINEKVLFEKEGHRLNSAINPLLDKLSSFVRRGDYPVEIVGHTDNRPAEEKGYGSNWEITGLMANQVQQYLIERGRIATKRLTAYGHSSYQPAVTNDTILSRRQNRRVEIVLHYQVPEHIKRILIKKPAGIFTYKRFHFKVF